jgi:2-hydroxy-4-carboxymuconate semialdehyde hemiacetal dehydrogenase
MSTPAIGILGPGAIADLHARALAASGVPLVAAAGPRRDDLDAFVARHRVPRGYADPAELLADPAVDAVIVAAPSHVHVALTRAALEAGKPVLCEVPLALSVEDARDIVALAADRDLPLGVAHTLRYWEPHRRLAEELRERGEEAMHVVVRSLMLRQTDAGWTGKLRDWTDSAVWHHGSHAVDAALWFLGDGPAAVHGTTGEPWTNGSVMDASFHLRTPDGRIGSVDLSYHARRPKADFLVITESHTWEIDGGALFRDGEMIFAGEVADVQEAAIIAQDDAFVAAVGGSFSGFYSGANALPTLEALAASS